MKKLILALLLTISFTGCSILNPSEAQYQKEKTKLEREIELLKLRKRKRVQELQLDSLDKKELEDFNNEKK